MKKAVLLLGIAAIMLAGCKNGGKDQTAPSEDVNTMDSASTEMDGHNSRNSLDWAGVYKGITPCDDCKGVETKLTLNKDNTYELSQIHLTEENGEYDQFSQSGSFTWKDNGSEIEIKTDEKTIQFRVEENQVRMLDLEGDVVDDELAEFYVLKKQS